MAALVAQVMLFPMAATSSDCLDLLSGLAVFIWSMSMAIVAVETSSGDGFRLCSVTVFRRRWWLNRAGLVWFCTRRLGRSIRGGFLFWGGSGRSNKGRKDDCVLLLHFFDGPLLGGISASVSSSSGGSQLKFVDGVEDSPVAVSVWLSTS